MSSRAPVHLAFAILLGVAGGSGCASTNVRPLSPDAPYEVMSGGPAGGCGVLKPGTARCWDPAGSFTVPGVSNAVDVALNYDRACAPLRDQTVVCWFTRSPNHEARAISGLADVRKVQLGLTSRGYALLSSGKIVRFSTDGRVGSPVDGVEGAVGFSVNELRGAAVDGSGRVFLWAEGGPSRTSSYYDYEIEGVARPVARVSDALEVSVGLTRSCVRHRSGSVSCWSHRGMEEQGKESFLAAALERVEGVGPVTRIVAAGGDVVCGLEKSGRVLCWGERADRALGVSSADTPSSPVRVPELDATELYGNCARRAGDGIVCWAEEAATFFELEPGFEVAYAIGGAAGTRAGFRQGLDAALRVAILSGYDSKQGPLAGGHVFTGFGTYATTLGLELGYGGLGEPSRRLAFPALTWGVGLGPEVRVDPELGWGGSARISGGVDPVELGLRLIGFAAPDSELMLLFTVGAARY